MTVDPACGGIAGVAGALWRSRAEADFVIGSRYVDGAASRMTPARRVGSRLLNTLFASGLHLPVADPSSLFRIAHRDHWQQLAIAADDYDILPEIIVRAFAGGWRLREVPISIDVLRRPRTAGAQIRLANAYRRMYGRLWLLRNSIEAADYDARAHDSRIPMQRYWQRRRYRHVTELIAGQGPVLDVGCGSSLIIGALPPGSVALDILPNKLRYARRFSRPLVRASGFALPFADASFPCVLCSQVIEHVPMDSPILDELCRVLAPGGRLVLGTPDYSRWEWVYTEKAYGFFKPNGYADEHIAHYSRAGLLRRFEALGFRHEATRYILRGELILAFRAPASPVSAGSGGTA
jgi:SAM-dependent methyltransferase